MWAFRWIHEKFWFRKFLLFSQRIISCHIQKLNFWVETEQYASKLKSLLNILFVTRKFTISLVQINIFKTLALVNYYYLGSIIVYSQQTFLLQRHHNRVFLLVLHITIFLFSCQFKFFFGNNILILLIWQLVYTFYFNCICPFEST